MARNALEGFGQGLMQAGQMMFEHNKQKMAEQLEAEREERKIAREEAKEERERQREKTTPDPSKFSYHTDDKGVVYEEVKNKFGETLERRPASPGTSEEVQLQRQKDKASIESALAMGAGRELDQVLKQYRVRDYEADRALDIQAAEARIAASNRSNQPDALDEPTPVDFAEEFINENPGLSSLTEGEEAPLTKSQLTSAVRAAYVHAAETGKPVTRELVNAVVRGYIRKAGKGKTKDSSTASGVVFPLDK